MFKICASLNGLSRRDRDQLSYPNNSLPIVSPSRLFTRLLFSLPLAPNPPTISLRFPTVRVDSNTGSFPACPFSFHPLEFSRLMFLTSRSRSLPPPLQSTRERFPSFPPTILFLSFFVLFLFHL